MASFPVKAAAYFACGMSLLSPESDAGVVLGAMLRSMSTTTSITGAGPFQMVPQPRGALENLRPQPLDIPLLALDELVVAVKAVGVNFRDVLNILGMYPGDPGPPGADCAGIVVAAGCPDSVLQPGDAVVGLAAGSLGSHVVTKQAQVVALPPGISAEAAATMPTVFMTVDAALSHAAEMQRGNRQAPFTSICYSSARWPSASKP